MRGDSELAVLLSCGVLKTVNEGEHCGTRRSCILITGARGARLGRAQENDFRPLPEMAARRVARQGLLLAEHSQPVASTSTLVPGPCPGCRRAVSSALPSAYAVAAAARTSDSSSSTPRAQQTSSWAAISRAAGQAIFSAPTQQVEPAPSQLSGAAAELVAHVKLKRPDADVAWSLFQQADLEGTTHLLPLISLHALVPALQSSASTKSLHFDVQHVTQAARVYQAKIDLVRLRITQAGGHVSQGDLAAMLWQFHALRYAPGATRVWDEMMQLGYTPSVSQCERSFETLHGWVDLHLRTGGKQVARVAAEPLVRKAVSMMQDLRGDAKRTSAVLEYFFKIALRARDARVFFGAMKEVYGFDVNYPGAEPVVPPNTRSTLRKMGEQEICWVLEMLGEQDDLSKMMAVFEVFDHPSPFSTSSSSTSATSSLSPYFDQSFSSSRSASDESGASTAVDSETSHIPHPIGTRAFTYMVQTASRLRNGGLVRHYFDQLMSRWQYEASERISRLEKVVGIEQTVEGVVDAGTEGEAATSTTRESRPAARSVPLSRGS